MWFYKKKEPFAKEKWFLFIAIIIFMVCSEMIMWLARYKWLGQFQFYEMFYSARRIQCGAFILHETEVNIHDLHLSTRLYGFQRQRSGHADTHILLRIRNAER